MLEIIESLAQRRRTTLLKCWTHPDSIRAQPEPAHCSGLHKRLEILDFRSPLDPECISQLRASTDTSFLDLAVLAWHQHRGRARIGFCLLLSTVVDVARLNSVRYHNLQWFVLHSDDIRFIFFIF